MSNIHSTLVLAWSIRLTSFLLHREFVNWKEWHVKLKEMNERSVNNSKSSPNRIPIWLTCATCYGCMIMPCIYRLKASSFIVPSSSRAKDSIQRQQQHQQAQSSWGIIGKMGITLQAVGLLLETIADYQKATFKSSHPSHRHQWCNVGLWNFSTHPNYLGEIFFWFGTYLGGISCCHNTIIQFALCTIGLFFILMVMKGAIDSLSSKHRMKWGHDVEWLEFKRTHSILGPLRVAKGLDKDEEVLPIYR